MKKLLLLPILILGMAYHSLAQTCAPNGITTNPTAPVNNQRPNMKNNFNWTQEWFPITWYYGGSNYPSSIQSPYFDRDNSFLSHFRDPIPGPKDMYPQDGWELVRKDFGNDGGGAVKNPYYILYNKYTGVLRVFVARGDQASMNGANIQINFLPSPTVSPMQTSLLDRNAELKAIDAPFTKNPVLSSVTGFLTPPGEWFYADFPMTYDPCTCLFQSKLEIKVTLSNNSKIYLEGGSRGEIVSQGKPTQAETAPSSFSFGDLMKGGKKAIDSYKSGNAAIKDMKSRVDSIVAKRKISSTEGQAKKDSVDKLTKLLVRSSFLRAGFKSFPYINTALSIVDFFISGGKKTAGTTIQDVNIMPMSINMSTQLKGQIMAEYLYSTINFRTPGSNPGSAPDSEYPLYNEVLGVFNLLKTPKIIYRTQSFLACNGACYGRSIHYRLAEDIQYVLNPASGLEVQEIQAALVADFRSTYSQTPRLEIESFNIATSLTEQRTEYVDLACMRQRIYGFYRTIGSTYDPEYPPTMRLKIMVNLRRKDATANTQNVLVVATYPVTVQQVSDVGSTVSCTTTTPLPPVSKEAVQTFCQSTTYANSGRFSRYAESLAQLELAEQQENKQSAETAIKEFRVYPNPTLDKTNVLYRVFQKGRVKITINDAMGRTIETLVDNAEHETGSFRVTFDGSKHKGSIYLCTIETDSYKATRKVVILK